MKLAISALALAGMISSPAVADTYYPILVGKNSILANLTTLKREGDIAKVWSILINEDTTSFDFALGRDEVNCATDERRNVAVTTYRMTGDIVKAEYVVRAWEPIIPHSNEAMLEKAACNPPDPKAVFTTTDSTVEVVRRIRAVVAGGK